MIIRDHDTGALYEVSVNSVEQRTLLLRELTAAETSAFDPPAWQHQEYYDIALEA